MSFLDNLLKQIGQAAANVGHFREAPEYGVSEFLRGDSSPTVPSQIASPMSQSSLGQEWNQSAPSRLSSPPGKTDYFDKLRQSSPELFNGSGGGGGGGVPANNGNQSTGESSGLDLAQAIRQAKLEMIGNRLNEYKKMAGEHLARATNLREGALGDIRDTSATIKGNARQTAGDIETKNRMAARASNRQGSSAYDQSLTNLNEGLGRTMGGINLEEAGGRRNVWDQYGQAESAANSLERSGLNDYGEDMANAEAQFASRLDAIKQANDLINATRGKYTGENVAGLQQGLLSSLGNLQAFNSGNTGGNVANQAISATQPTDIQSILEELRKKSVYS